MILNTILSRDLLIDAYKFYSRGDARAHDALKIIINRNDMLAAVLGCLEEATKEDEPDKQNLFIQAACFGKKFHPGTAIEEFPTACRTLRVMNICRAQNLDPNLDLDGLIEQLIHRRNFDLALWIVKWLRKGGERKVLESWCDFIIQRRHLKDDQVASRIQLTLGQNPVVPYADVASKAIEHNRIKLAIKLIENEGQSSKQIPLLLGLKQYDLVLAQALSTCDSNLIYMAIFKLKESIASEVKFVDLLKKHRLAFQYLRNYLAATDISKLIMISYADNPKEEITLYLLDNRLESAMTVSRRSKQEFVTHQIEAQIKLEKFHQGLRQFSPPLVKKATWTGLSVCETITNLVSLGQSSKAKDCQRKFDISDRKYRVLEQIALNILPKLTIPSIDE